MIRSSRRACRTKAVAEVLAMIANTNQFGPGRARHALDVRESLFESATEFCAALEIYAARTAQLRKSKH
jgi:hypothetical protein